MSVQPVTHTLGVSQQVLYNGSGPLLHAVEVLDYVGCDGCFFRNRGCPVTSTGCATCTADVREDGKTIVWQVAV